jgi:hypothetical protein
VNTATQNQKMLIEALQHLQMAIDLLDCAAAPDHIAGHVDLAACQLQELVPPADVARIRLRDSTDEGVDTV